MSREYRILKTHRYSSRWANRVNRVAFYDTWEDLMKDSNPSSEHYIPVDDRVILCDLCNKPYSQEPETEILILQVRYEGEEWYDVGTRCSECMKHETQELDIEIVEEE